MHSQRAARSFVRGLEIRLNARLFTHQGESAATQWVKKDIQTKCLTEAEKLFIGVWCDTDIYFICNDRAGELLVVESWPYPSFLVLHVLSSLPSFYHKYCIPWTPSYQLSECSFLTIYHKPPTISPGLIFFRKQFLMGLHKGDLYMGGGGGCLYSEVYGMYVFMIFSV